MIVFIVLTVIAVVAARTAAELLDHDDAEGLDRNEARGSLSVVRRD